MKAKLFGISMMILLMSSPVAGQTDPEDLDYYYDETINQGDVYEWEVTKATQDGEPIGEDDSASAPNSLYQGAVITISVVKDLDGVEGVNWLFQGVILAIGTGEFAYLNQYFEVKFGDEIIEDEFDEGFSFLISPNMVSIDGGDPHNIYEYVDADPDLYENTEIEEGLFIQYSVFDPESNEIAWDIETGLLDHWYFDFNDYAWDIEFRGSSTAVAEDTPLQLHLIVFTLFFTAMILVNQRKNKMNF